MLDFGTDMDSRENTDNRSDDLFSAPDCGDKAEETAAEMPRRPMLKRPVLPQYKEPPVQDTQRKAIQPALRNNPHFLHRKRKSEEFSMEDKMEVSRILKAARTESGLSINDVESATQIRAHYVAALEDADYDKLPQPVYVLAYLRKLCNLYDISAQEEEHLVLPWRNIPCDLPDNLPASVQQDGENENRKVLYRLELILLASGALIVIGLVVLAVVLTVSYFSGKDVPESRFDNTRLLEIQEKPQLVLPERKSNIR